MRGVWPVLGNHDVLGAKDGHACHLGGFAARRRAMGAEEDLGTS